MIYVVKERVVFEYVWRIEATSRAEARRAIDGLGDGEAESHEEIRRTIHSVDVDESGDELRFSRST